MRILVSTGPAYGLYNPVVPIAWALRSAGHQVLVAGPEPLAAMARTSGLPFVPTYGPMHMKEVMRHDRSGKEFPNATTDDGQLEQIGRGFGRLAARTLPGMLQAVDRFRPDLIISEPRAYAAGVAARLRDIPWAQHGVGMHFRPDVEKYGADEFRPELEENGLDGLPEPDMFLDNCPPSVGHKDRDPGRPLRYVPYDPAGTVPSWSFEKGRRPRLLLTLGTVEPESVGVKRNFGSGVPLFRELVRVLPEAGVDLVIAAADPVVEQLGTLSESVVAAGWISLTSVVPSCDLIVHHVGSGSTMSGVINGLPQLLLSRNAEHTVNAQLLEEYGSARQITDQDVEPKEVLDACRALLEVPSYKERATELAAEVASLPSPAETVAVLEALAGR
ncbi:glycosyltransferase [Streptomyces sp. CB03234]|uniref:glycosyltransferase n=1 Tax=Streptomyces sp. (strain CB03234) TaxID=1703937 RepID=UPI00117C0DA0|nr:nucleotide disphospho-sugar-binding domain-containing protein [Streptomyces sp. CB03234]